MNIRQMAQKAGVSVATISRAINSQTRRKLAPATLKSIDALIEKYGYTPHWAARHLNRASTKTVGILFPYFYSIFNHHYYVDILAGVADALISTEYRFKILLSRESAGKWDRYDFKKGESIDGLLVTHWPMFFSDPGLVKSLKIPTIILSDYQPSLNACFMCGDQVSGGRKAAEHLYALGHRKFAVIKGSDGSLDGALRVKGFEGFLKGKKITIDPGMVLQADYREDFAYERIERLFLSKSLRPTAVFCANDRMALGALRKLQEMGIRCPEDVSVVGFDNDPKCKEAPVLLTTINVPLYHIAREAVLALIRAIEHPAKLRVKGKKLFPVDLIVRASTASSSR